MWHIVTLCSKIQIKIVQKWPESVIKTDPAPTEPHRHLLDTGKLGGRRVAEVGEVRGGRLLSLCVIPPEGSFWPSSFLLFIPPAALSPSHIFETEVTARPACSLYTQNPSYERVTGAAFAKTSTSLQSPKHVLTPHPCIVELELSIVSPLAVSSTPPGPPLADSPVAFYFSTFPLLFSCPKDTQKRCLCITPPEKGIFHSKKPKRSWKWSCTRFFLCLWQVQ